MTLASKNELRPVHTQDRTPLPSGLVLFFCCMSSTCDFSVYRGFGEEGRQSQGNNSCLYPLLLTALVLNKVAVLLEPFNSINA